MPLTRGRVEFDEHGRLVVGLSSADPTNVSDASIFTSVSPCWLRKVS